LRLRVQLIPGFCPVARSETAFPFRRGGQTTRRSSTCGWPPSTRRCARALLVHRRRCDFASPCQSIPPRSCALSLMCSYWRSRLIAPCFLWHDSPPRLCAGTGIRSKHSRFGSLFTSAITSVSPDKSVGPATASLFDANQTKTAVQGHDCRLKDGSAAGHLKAAHRRCSLLRPRPVGRIAVQTSAGCPGRPSGVSSPKCSTRSQRHRRRNQRRPDRSRCHAIDNGCPASPSILRQTRREVGDGALRRGVGQQRRRWLIGVDRGRV